MEFYEQHIKQMIRTRLWTLATEKPNKLHLIISSGTPEPLYQVLIHYFQDNSTDWEWFLQNQEFLIKHRNEYLDADHYELVDRIFQWYLRTRKRKVLKKNTLKEAIERIDKQIYGDIY
ncbi:MAG: hypothetical protein ACE5R6_11135 [Candidatus Heimdallarchaeota archaeon]